MGGRRWLWADILKMNWLNKSKMPMILYLVVSQHVALKKRGKNCGVVVHFIMKRRRPLVLPLKRAFIIVLAVIHRKCHSNSSDGTRAFNLCRGSLERLVIVLIFPCRRQNSTSNELGMNDEKIIWSFRFAATFSITTFTQTSIGRSGLDYLKRGTHKRYH